MAVAGIGLTAAVSAVRRPVRRTQPNRRCLRLEAVAAPETLAAESRVEAPGLEEGLDRVKDKGKGSLIIRGRARGISPITKVRATRLRMKKKVKPKSRLSRRQSQLQSRSFLGLSRSPRRKSDSSY
jgi:hypothetical protein